MSCTANYHGAFGSNCEPSMNERLAKSLEAFSGNTRKAMKLLAKQYIVVAIEAEDDTIYQGIDLRNRVIIRKRSIIIRYGSKENQNQYFEWNIEAEEIKY